MLVLLAGIFVVHIATVIMLFVSTIANVSRDHPGRDTAIAFRSSSQPFKWLAGGQAGGCSGL